MLYRYFNSVESTGHGLRLVEYPERRRTKCGVWIYDSYARRERFVNLQSIKRFAHETREQALAAFIKRRERQVRILKVRFEEAKIVLEIAKSGRIDDHRPLPFDLDYL